MSAALLFLQAPRDLTDQDRTRFESTASRFPRRIQVLGCVSAEAPGAIVRVWSRGSERSAGLSVGRENTWLAMVGNPTRSDLAGKDSASALRSLLAEAAGTSGFASTLSPPFAAILHHGGGVLDAAVDRAGLQHLYLTEDDTGATWMSSSGLALAASANAAIDPEALAEWLSAGHFISARTLFRGVRKLRCGELIRLSREGVKVLGAWQPTSTGTTFEDPLEQFIEALVDALDACHGGDGVATELTGGLDSRLLLATSLANGLPIRTWTIGQKDCAELQTIRRLIRRRSFAHNPVLVTPELGRRLPELTRDMHELSDGEVSALEYAPLLLAFEQASLVGRKVSISGGGGEIARGYYFGVLRSRDSLVRGVSLSSLLRKVTSSTAGVHMALRREVCPAPAQPAADAIEQFLRESTLDTPEGILEDFYLRARMQRFAGRNVSTTGVFYRQAAPFFANRFLDLTLALPYRHKRNGLIVRRAILQLCPELATVPLDTGMPVRPMTFTSPAAQAARLASMARRGLVKFGGPVGSGIARRPPETIPWHAASREPAFQDFVRDLLLGPDNQIDNLLEPAPVRGHVERGLATGELYPLSLLMTLELTLRRLRTLRLQADPPARVASPGSSIHHE